MLYYKISRTVQKQSVYMPFTTNNWIFTSNKHELLRSSRYSVALPCCSFCCFALCLVYWWPKSRGWRLEVNSRRHGVSLPQHNMCRHAPHKHSHCYPTYFFSVNYNDSHFSHKKDPSRDFCFCHRKRGRDSRGDPANNRSIDWTLLVPAKVSARGLQITRVPGYFILFTQGDWY